MDLADDAAIAAVVDTSTSGPARSARRLREDLEAAVGRAVVGADAPLRLILTALLADGHVLVEDVPGDRQDAPRPGGRPGAGPRHEPDPGHAGSPAGRRHRLEPVRGRHAPVRAGAGLHEHPARRRDQPGHAADPGGPARGDAGAPGLDRGDDPAAARPVHRPRDPEPDRVRGHVRPAPGPARPVPRCGSGSAIPTRRAERSIARRHQAAAEPLDAIEPVLDGPAAARPPRRGPAGPRRRRGRGVRSSRSSGRRAPIRISSSGPARGRPSPSTARRRRRRSSPAARSSCRTTSRRSPGPSSPTGSSSTSTRASAARPSTAALSAILDDGARCRPIARGLSRPPDRR